MKISPEIQEALKKAFKVLTYLALSLALTVLSDSAVREALQAKIGVEYYPIFMAVYNVIIAFVADLFKANNPSSSIKKIL